jgi:undecaprenyl-diphosphatase
MLQSKILILFLLPFIAPHFLQANPEDHEVGEYSDSRIGYEEALVFGLVEGITEFLPVSSTGHLILANEWIKKPGHIELSEQEAINAYLIVIQAGAIFAVAIIYWRRIISVFLGFVGLDGKGRKLGINLITAFIPAALLGPLLDSWIESILFGPIPVALALIAGSLFMYWAEKSKMKIERVGGEAEKGLDELTLKYSFMVGLLQCVAMCPGTSRSMMTIVGGYLVGLSRKQSAEFSFLLGLVTLTAAALYKGVTSGKAIVTNIALGPMLLGCLIAGISAAVSVRWLVGYLSRNGLGLFVWYRLALGLIVLVYFGMFNA